MGKITPTPVSEAGGEVDWLVEHLLSWPCTGDERDGKSEAYIDGLMRQAARRIEALAKPASSPAVDIEALTYRVANAKLGEGTSVRCEGPTNFEKDQARAWVKRVLRALSQYTSDGRVGE